jgi:methionine biosynthesis protein MetW
MFYFSNFSKKGFDHIQSINYDAYWKDRGFEINKKLKEREVIMFNEIPERSKVLDVGCGNSLLPVRLKEKKSCDVAVGDISSVVLEGFKKLGITTYSVDLEKTDTLTFPATYDYIVMSEVLEHTRNPEDILQTLRKYTKTFLLTVPNSAFYRYRIHLMFTGTFLRQWVHHPSEHVRYWSHTDFLMWLKALGLDVKYSHASNGFSLFGIKLYKFFPNMFGHQIVYVVSTS